MTNGELKPVSMCARPNACAASWSAVVDSVLVWFGDAAAVKASVVSRHHRSPQSLLHDTPRMPCDIPISPGLPPIMTIAYGSSGGGASS